MRITDYINETKAELKHVTWPSRRQSIVYTIVVIVIAVGTGIILGLFDSGFSSLLQKFLGQ
jgi:preprotein translocase subunit SecE